MNYIQKLKEENVEYINKINSALDEIIAIRCYLQSNKFCCGNELDGYVSISDVQVRLDNVRDALN